MAPSTAALSVLLAAGVGLTLVCADVVPNPNPIQLTLADGTQSPDLMLEGSAKYLWMTDANGYTVVEEDDGSGLTLEYADVDETEEDDDDEKTDAATKKGGKKGGRKKRQKLKASPCIVGQCNPAKFGLQKNIKDDKQERQRQCTQGEVGTHRTKKQPEGVKGRRDLAGMEENPFCTRAQDDEVSGVIAKAKEMRKFRKGTQGVGGVVGPAKTAGAPQETEPHRGPEYWEGGKRNLARQRLRAHRGRAGDKEDDASRALVTASPTANRYLADADEVTLMKNFVVNIRFSDHANRDLPSEDDIYELFNEEDCTSVNCPTGSVRDHFLWNSHGRLDLTSTVFPWVNVSKTEKEYGDGYYGCTGEFTAAIIEALTILDDKHNIDFSQFDMDGNGFVDAITVLHSGYGAEWGGQPCGDPAENGMVDRIWSHKWDLGAGCSGSGSTRKCRHANQNLDDGSWSSNDQSGPNGENTKVLSYHVSPGIWGTCGSAIGRIGVIVHETLHFLGLPDLYDGSGGKGLGNYCTMGNSWGWDGSQHYPPMLNPWAKWHLGWLEYTPIGAPGTKTLLPSESRGMVYQITDGFDVDAASGMPKEYLLVEFRKKFNDKDDFPGLGQFGKARSFEQKIPKEGVIVWHVDEPELKQHKDWQREGHPGQGEWPENGNHYLVSILPADGGYGMERGEDNGHMGEVITLDEEFELGPGGISGTDVTQKAYPNTDTYLDGDVRKTNIKLSKFISFLSDRQGDVKQVEFDYENPNAGAAAPSTIWTVKTTYSSGEDVEVSFDNPNNEAGDRIALYTDREFGDTVSGEAVDYFHADGSSGTKVFGNVAAGTYRALVIRTAGPPHAIVAKSTPFVVHAAATPAPTPAPTSKANIYLECQNGEACPDQPELVVGQTIDINVACDSDSDWYGVVKASEVQGSTLPAGKVKEWAYCCGEVDHAKCQGKTTENEKKSLKGDATRTLDPGDYKVVLLTMNYDILDQTQTLHLSAAVAPTNPPVPAPTPAPVPAPTDPPVDVDAGTGPTTIKATKDTFTKPENIACTFDHPAANTDDWLAIYKSDEVATMDAQGVKYMPRGVHDWEYICGSQDMCTTTVTSATVSFRVDQPQGSYQCCVLENGSGDPGYVKKACSAPFNVVLPTSGQCKGWCEGLAGHAWSSKCSWKNSCDGCGACASLVSAVPQLSSARTGGTTSDLTTHIEGGAANHGAMFDVESAIPVEVRSFSVVLGDSDEDVPVKVFTKEGTYEGHEDTPASWTEICSASVASKGLTEPTPIPASDCAPVDMIPNEVRSFYVTVAGHASLRLTPSYFPEGSVFARNNDVSVMVGKGVGPGEFGDETCQRQFNGAIHYEPAGVPNSGSTAYPLGGNPSNVGSPDDPVDGALGSECSCDDCREGMCSAATGKCEDEEAS